MTKEMYGIIVPIVTPFNSDETVNEAGLRTIVDWLIERGVHGLFPSGSQGELFSLSTDEKKRVMDIVVEQSAGRVAVMPSTGDVTTRVSIELSRHAEASGADAVSVITPYFIKPSDKELEAHYLEIAQSVSIPVLAYNNPGRTGVPISPAVVSAVAHQAGNFVGIKDSSGDLSNALSYILECPPTFSTFMGRDTLIYAGLCYGCKGAVAASANVAAELAVSIYDAYMAGDHALALERQKRLAPLRRAFTLGSFPVVVKDAMEIMGLPAGPCRRPIQSLQGAPRETLVRILRDLELID